MLVDQSFDALWEDTDDLEILQTVVVVVVQSRRVVADILLMHCPHKMYLVATNFGPTRLSVAEHSAVVQK